jgi:hypothetical protein
VKFESVKRETMSTKQQDQGANPLGFIGVIMTSYIEKGVFGL